MGFLSRLIGRDKVVPDKKYDSLFLREEMAVMYFEHHCDKSVKTCDNVAHVSNHELMLRTLKEFQVSRQGFINGYVRVYNRVPYWLADDEYVGEE